jgi:hypothetical protein
MGASARQWTLPFDANQRIISQQSVLLPGRRIDGGTYGQTCSRSGRFGTFSGCRIGPGLWVAGLWVRLRRTLRLRSSRLRLRRLRLRSSSIRLRSSSTDRYYRDARARLRSAAGGVLRARLLGRRRLGRIRGCRVLGALKTPAL